VRKAGSGAFWDPPAGVISNTTILSLCARSHLDQQFRTAWKRRKPLTAPLMLGVL